MEVKGKYFAWHKFSLHYHITLIERGTLRPFHQIVSTYFVVTCKIFSHHFHARVAQTYTTDVSTRLPNRMGIVFLPFLPCFALFIDTRVRVHCDLFSSVFNR